MVYLKNVLNCLTYFFTTKPKPLILTCAQNLALYKNFFLIYSNDYECDFFHVIENFLIFCYYFFCRLFLECVISFQYICSVYFLDMDHVLLVVLYSAPNRSLITVSTFQLLYFFRILNLIAGANW